MRAQIHRVETRCLLPRPLAQVFPFFSDPANLERLTPPWLRFEVLGKPGRAHAGQVIDYRLRLRGLPLRWRTLITHWEPPRRFVDVAVQSPYGLWHHEHRFEARGRQTLMTDRVHYSLPLAPLGDWLAARYVRADVERIFAYRSQAVQALFPPAKRR
jgi:ligand-binding SRPBCC domain-containing protein